MIVELLLSLGVAFLGIVLIDLKTRVTRIERIVVTLAEKTLPEECATVEGDPMEINQPT